MWLCFCCFFFFQGIALLGGMIFFYVKYKSLEKHYRKMNDKDHEEDEMKVVYHEDMQAGKV